MALSPQADGRGLLIEALGLPAGELWAEYVLAGEAAQRAKLVAAGEAQAVTLLVDLRFRASGAVAIVDSAGRPGGPEFSAAFVGRGLAAPAPADVFSADGRLWLHLPEGSLAQDTFVLVSSFGGLPGDWPAGWAPAGPAYAVNYPAGQPAPAGRLRLRPDPGQLAVRPAEPVTLVGRPEDTPAWCRLPTAASEPDNSVSTAWGAGLVAAAWPAETRVYLPLVQR
jgi:hypothetical protein